MNFISLQSLQTKFKSIQQKSFESIDGSSLAFFRIAFAGIMIWEVYRYFSKNWIYRYYIEPKYNFTFDGFGWVSPWSGDGMYFHFYAMGIFAFFMLIGFCYRLFATLFFLAFSYVFLLEATNYLNHFYLICLISFLLIFTPAHNNFSIKSLLKGQQEIPRWSLWIMQFQIACVYFFGGIAKINLDWLSAMPMRNWLSGGREIPAIGFIFESEITAYIFSYGGLLLDLFVIPLLLYKPTRWLAILALLFFHLMNAALFHIGIFPWFMLLATSIFFSPSWPQKFLRKIPSKIAVIKSNTRQVQQKIIFASICIYVFLQVTIPLRHFLYPGNVSWTEEGHQFSWHMKLRSKSAKIKFLIEDVETGKSQLVNLHEMLNKRQIKKMSKRPFLIRQFSEYIAQEHFRKYGRRVKVYASSMVSLNYRKAQPLIDSTVDLSQVGFSWRPAKWILALQK